MVDYRIDKVGIGQGRYGWMVNGEMVRWDDYDYCDPDPCRQAALKMAEVVPMWGQDFCPLGVNVEFGVMLVLKTDWLGKYQRMTERDIVDAKLDIFRMEDQLDQPGDFL